MLGDVAEKTMHDNLNAAAVSTTQISVNNLLNDIHMDKYKDDKEKMLSLVDNII